MPNNYMKTKYSNYLSEGSLSISEASALNTATRFSTFTAFLSASDASPGLSILSRNGSYRSYFASMGSVYSLMNFVLCKNHKES